MGRSVVPRTVGFGAGILALTLVVFSVSGILWGLWRPRITATVVENGGFLFDPASPAQFQSFGSFVIATSLLSGVISFAIFAYAKSRRGLGTMFYIAVMVVIGSVVFWVVGGFIAPSVSDIELGIGNQVSWAPVFAPGLGLAAAPFISLVVYWSGLFLVSEDTEADLKITSLID